MKRISILALACIALISPAKAEEPVAGSTVLGIAAAELRDVAAGWSARRQVLGQEVFDDKNERIGTIDDIVIAPDKSVSYAIIGVGGFLAIGRHDVAIRASKLKLVDSKLVLAGATKDALKALPRFEYAH
jgi:sporulation protein YlmC with PRC-barrel domain